MASSPDRLTDRHIGELRRLHYWDTGKVIPRQRFLADQVMIEAGASGDNNFIFILLGGSVRVQREGQTFAELSGPGVFVGEIAALFPQTKRTATVIAKESLRALKLTPDDLAGLNGAEGLLRDVHEIIRNTASARVETMSLVERQAAGFPTGPDLLKFGSDPIVFHPTRFFKRDVEGLLVERSKAREVKAEAEASKSDLLRRKHSHLHRAIDKVLSDKVLREQQQAKLQAEQNKKLPFGESAASMPPKRPLHDAIELRATTNF